jgi:hypothetical protein
MALSKIIILIVMLGLLLQSCRKQTDTHGDTSGRASTLMSLGDSIALAASPGAPQLHSGKQNRGVLPFDAAHDSVSVHGRTFIRNPRSPGRRVMAGSDPFSHYIHGKEELYLFPEFVVLVCGVDTYAGDSICVFQRNIAVDTALGMCTVDGRPIYTTADMGVWFNGILDRYLLIDLGTGPDRGFSVHDLLDSSRSNYSNDTMFEVRVVPPDSIEYGEIMKTKPDERDFPQIVAWRESGLSPVLVERVILCLRDYSHRRTGIISCEALQ